jgi:hypothetical protein
MISVVAPAGGRRPDLPTVGAVVTNIPGITTVEAMPTARRETFHARVAKPPGPPRHQTVEPKIASMERHIRDLMLRLVPRCARCPHAASFAA